MPEPDIKLAAILKKAGDEIDRLLLAEGKTRRAHKLKVEKILKQGLINLDPGLRESFTKIFAHIFGPLPPEPPLLPPEPPVKKKRR